ncbi:MAG: DUF1329 domain-containing protein [Desulfobacterales bacterium]|jgi:hypothetical protein|nr:DUF1329 domain-containing protein [Desulfobacteraceae bacterium]MBT4364596.1 DUF1329 domain-containing protein [Desulfobacteraceae bacterium]MBT7697380.1 DUF1329 domain-containing protein [Desulfobacterales bacterium]
MKRLFIVSILTFFLAGLFLQPCLAWKGSEGWEERQNAMLEKHGLKVGEVYDASNGSKIKHLLPESVYNKWLMKGGWKFPIGKFDYYYGVEDRWMKKHAKANAGKYTLDSNAVVIEVATGKFPIGRTGITFPMDSFDVKTDPKAGHKILHNGFSVQSVTSAYFRDFTVDWVGIGGYEKSFFAWINYFNYEGGGAWKPNPNLFKQNDLLYFTGPHDIEGAVNLSWKYLDGSPTKGFFYVPAIRRVKRLNGANRSDPTQGSDFCVDDSNGFAGDPESMEAKYIGQKDFLFPVLEADQHRVLKGRRAADGTYVMPPGYSAVKANYLNNNPDPNVDMWALEGIVFVPRTGYQVELFPKDPYYNYGKQILWIDQEGLLFVYKEVDDRAGEYWKTAIVMYTALQYGDDKYVGNGAAAYAMVDDKAHHASIAPVMGSWKGYDFRSWYNTNRMKPSAFTPQAISTMSR